jgi:Mn2+/Fe2+ NRAMP family transporter
MKKLIQSVGPAIIVAAVVLGPGSILTSSKVGATVGLAGLPVVIGAVILMIAMVALAARLGAVYEGSIGDELAKRVGRPVTVTVGLILFVLIALFQSSNNIALIGGIEPLFADQPIEVNSLGTSGEVGAAATKKEQVFGPVVRSAILVCFNGLIILSLYLLPNLYQSVENLMKLLIGLMTVAFLINFFVVFASRRAFEPVANDAPFAWIPLLGMIGTTFSVAGAFYQAYLVKEKGWGIGEIRRGLFDSVISISVLGFVTSIILLSSWRVFCGRPGPTELGSVGDIAMQLEPLFGPSAKIVFCVGILAGAISSFLVNALIGGTVLSDTLGKGSKLTDRWPLYLTTLALMVGGAVAIASLAREGSTVHLITLAQALTVLGVPALALALIYLGTRPELKGQRRVPRTILVFAIIGLAVSCGVAVLTATKVYQNLKPSQPAAVSCRQVMSQSPVARWRQAGC